MDVDELYQDIIIDHYKHPRHAGTVTEEEALADEFNPTCGDRIRLTAALADGRLRGLRYACEGCAISTASSSLMSEYAEGRPAAEARAFALRFIAMLRDEQPWEVGAHEELEALQGVKQFPLRVKCATMCWHALLKALDRLK